MESEVLTSLSPCSKVFGCSPIIILELIQIFLDTQLHFCEIATQHSEYINFMHV